MAHDGAALELEALPPAHAHTDVVVAQAARSVRRCGWRVKESSGEPLGVDENGQRRLIKAVSARLEW